LVLDGFGFISGADGNEYFFHKASFQAHGPAKGETVNFEVGRFKARTVAKNVRPIDGTPVSRAARNEHNLKSDYRMRFAKLRNGPQFQNWFFDEVAWDIFVADSVLKVFLFLYRKTIGWNNARGREISYPTNAGANVRSRNTAIHAVAVLCDCWGLWKKTRGVRGEHSSIFEPASITSVEQFRERSMQTSYIYNSVCPTLEPTERPSTSRPPVRGVKSLMESNRPGIEKQKLIRQFC